MEEKVPKTNYKNVIGIDFGTTSTYVTICPYGTRNKLPLYLTGKVPAIDTVILYSDVLGADPNVFPMIGENATITFGQADEKDILKEQYRYYSNFKLEIVTNQTARKCAVDFFKSLIRDAILNFTPLNTEDNRVIIGAPSQANDEFRKTLMEIAKEATINQVEIMDEPIGALLTDLGSHRFPLSDVLEGYLVIDFGGGTCDFAYLKQGQVVRSWGNFELGGRLYDDLFYQWFGDQNPKVIKNLKSLKRDFYVWSYLCRQLKEDFSETISKNPKASMKAEVGRFGEVKNLTKEEFLERAKNYRPSLSFLEYYERLGISLSDKLLKDKIDLIDWFSESLKEGLKDINEIKAVSLSGGSSRWFFVKDICNDELKIDKSMILNTFNPFGAISEGLSILPAIQDEFFEIIKKITNDKRAFISCDITNHVEESMEKCFKVIVNNVMVNLFDTKIVPCLKGYIDKDVNIETIETDISAIIANYDEDLKALINKTFKEEITSIVAIAYNKLEAWLLSYGLRLGKKGIKPDENTTEVIVDSQMVSEHLVNLLSVGLAGLASFVTSAILATISGGGGIALIASGPHGLIAGAVGGLMLGGIGWLVGQEKLKSWAKKQELPNFFLKIIGSDRVIRKVRNDVEKNLAQQFSDFITNYVVKLSNDLDVLITKEIENLGMVNIF
jgi:hypothetical protein